MPDWTKWPTLKIDEHGGVSEGGSEMSKIDGGDSKNPLYCSFCGKSQHEVRKLIAGPTVFVCDECVELCVDIIGEENKSSLTKSGDKIPTPRRSARFSTTTSSARTTPRRCSRSRSIILTSG